MEEESTPCLPPVSERRHEYTYAQRVIDLFVLLSLGRRLSVREVARRYRISSSAAHRLLCNVSATISIYSEHGQWQMPCDDER